MAFFSCAVLKCLLLLLMVLSAAISAEDNSNSCDPQEGTCRIYPILGKPSEYTNSSIGVKLAVRRWVPPPDNDITSVVIFVHGGAGFHSAYADIMGQSLRDAGIAVIAYDNVGSGYSDGMNGGLRNYFDSMDTLTNDFTKILKKVRKEYPERKVFAMGESFGCMVLLSQALKEQENAGPEGSQSLADGYVLTGPVVKLLPEMLPPKPVIKILCFLAWFFPMLSTPGTDFFSTFDLAFGDKSWAQTGRADPMIQEAAGIPPKLGMTASLLSNFDKVYGQLEEVRVPFKIFMGENEHRVDVDAVHHLAKVAKSTDKDIEIVKGGYHQLFQDVPEVTQLVCRHIQDWILARS